MSKQVVILGGGLAGIATAHKLLKHTIPKVKDFKVVLVSPSSHFYWNIATVRGIIPDEITDEQLFHAIEPGFAKYPSSQFEFVLGTASALDTASSTVKVDTPDADQRSIPYAHLVIATGSSTTTGLPFKLLGSHEKTASALHDLQSSVGAAGSIIVAGAGPTGVEVAGELAGRYGATKKVTLVMDGKQSLPGCMPSVRRSADADLAKLGVELVRGARVTEVRESGDGKQKDVVLSTGKTLSADLFIPIYGVRPNSGFLPAELLDSNGYVKLRKTLQTVGLDNVWAVGDVGDAEVDKKATRAEAQVLHLATNLDAALRGDGVAGVVDYKPTGWPITVVTIGKQKGTGQIGNIKVFGFMVSFIKGRTLFMERPPDIIAGKIILQSSI